MLPNEVSVTNLFNQLVSSTAGAFLLLGVAAFLEVFGDACFQSGMYQSTGAKRAGWFVAGSLVLIFYSVFVNTPKWDFGRLLGVYVVLFFVVAQVVAKLRFGQSPTAPIYAGGALIVLGGAVMTFWKG
jgi:small multidrug resistance family-3 protein